VPPVSIPIENETYDIPRSIELEQSPPSIEIKTQEKVRNYDH